MTLAVYDSMGITSYSSLHNDTAHSFQPRLCNTQGLAESREDYLSLRGPLSKTIKLRTYTVAIGRVEGSMKIRQAASPASLRPPSPLKKIS